MNDVVLVTGANGFIGSALCRALTHNGEEVRAAVRRRGTAPTRTEIVVDDIVTTDWSSILDGVTTVIHVAGRAHVLKETATDPAQAFDRTNVDGTIRLAIAAQRAGVRRFIFLSSIGVNGEGSMRPYCEADVPNPINAYTCSKWKAEQALRALSNETQFAVTIVRPPLVFGPEVPGNFLKLLRWVDRGVPLPLATTGNSRSIIYVENLARFLVICATSSAARNETFVIADPVAPSTTELLRIVATNMHRPTRLFAISPRIAGGLARIVGRETTFRRLFGTLVVDTSKASALLGWAPPVAFEDGMRQTVTWYLETRNS